MAWDIAQNILTKMDMPLVSIAEENFL